MVLPPLRLHGKSLRGSADMTGEWIWENSDNREDEHCEFRTLFYAEQGNCVRVRISCDTDFVLYINGIAAGFGQYPDYPHYKIYETFDVSAEVRSGENILAIEAYHGGSCSTHWLGKSGLRFDVEVDGKIVLGSGAHVQSRLSRMYESHVKRYVSPQLGYSYNCDLCREDGWRTQHVNGFHDSVIIEGMATEFFPRPIEKVRLGEFSEGKLLDNAAVPHLYDLGRETTGYPELTVRSDRPVSLRFCWGEHIADGEVRSIIQNRDFSVIITVPAGETEFTSLFLRLGARYLQIECKEKIEVLRCGLRVAEYPHACKNPAVFFNPLRQKIYDTCVRTLELCMHDHYEDCPWREQAMYALDSRNQMLCGYFAFGEFAFARASLELMCNDKGIDGYMTICFPTNFALKIPSFSLYWFMQMREYTEYSGDVTLVEKYFDKMQALLELFLSRVENGLIPNFYGDKTFWNFYEWSDGLSGNIFSEEEKRFDLPLNCLLSIAMSNTDFVRRVLGKSERYAQEKAALNDRIDETFFDAKKGLYRDFTDSKHYSEFGNALAVLCGAARGERAKRVGELISAKSNDLVPASLSTASFVYDAVLNIDKNRYADFVLGDIDAKYGYMLQAGATSFWETLSGEKDFGGAGSLCHGWSAMPIYYYHLLEQVRG